MPSYAIARRKRNVLTSNYTEVGNFAKISNGVASKFSASNFVKTPETFPAPTTSFEAKAKVVTPSAFDVCNIIYYCGGSFAIQHDAANVSVISFWIYKAGTGFERVIAVPSTTLLATNTSYWFKVTWDGSVYNLLYSTDDVIYTSLGTYASTTPLLSSGTVAVGLNDGGSKYPYLGSIDLSQSYINIDGERWWSSEKQNKYYKDIVTTKYWKEVTTGGRELEYACYSLTDSGMTFYSYAKVPLGSDKKIYTVSGGWGNQQATTSSELAQMSNLIYSSLTEDQAKSDTNVPYTRYTAGDLYKDTTVTTVVEGTPDDYTYTTTEETTIEVSANDDYDRVESGGGYSKVGSWIDDYEASGFSASQYLTLPTPFKPDSNNWEVLFKFTTGTDITSNQFVVGGSDVNAPHFHIKLTESKIAIDIGNGSSWQASVLKGSSTLLINTEYWTKLIFDGSQYSLYLSTDGETYNLENTFISSTPIGNMTITKIGVPRSNAEPFLGSIDLSQSHIKINNELWWTGTKLVPENKYYVLARKENILTGNYTEVGNFAKISKGVASGFSVGTLLQTPDIIDTSSNTWERVIKITTGDVSSNQSIWGTIPDYKGMLLRLYDGKLHFWVSSNGTSWNIASDATSALTLLGVRNYYIKTSFNGSQYLVDVSTNGVDYTNYITVASSTNTVAGKISIGGHGVSEISFDTPFLGSVDLNETYIKVGDETVWSGDSYRGIGSWNNDNYVSGFTASNYLKLPKSFAPANNPWEVSIPFITGAFNARQRIFNSTTDFVGVMLVIEPAGTFTLALSSGNTSWNIGAPVSSKTISANVMYTAKISFTGTQYKLDIYNHNSGTWENYITVDNSSPVSANTYVIGRSENDSFPQPLSGLIDLNNSYIKINDELWWTGTKLVPENKYYMITI